ncbi:vinorine synthase-like [Senna tora]|uniref:Vinorine synthase-like n=1 Tax=Senna tora TaxID=362788 RepID=A0A834WGM7_9FABA|nr:vinorine synthase-like [Senna tora]
MEIKVISKESIKPSEPTPEHHKTFKLSSFDLLHRNTYFPLILFYPQIPNPNTNVASQLKKSLSEILTIFYPLAGRRNDAVSVSCNDEGAPFLEATANASISEFLNPPRLESLNRLLPIEPYRLLIEEGGSEGEVATSSSSSLPNVAVQVTRFSCGGVAIGVCNLHTVMDACSCGVMMKAWSAICREEREEMAWPDFENAFALFPPRDFSGMRAGLLGSKIELETNCRIQRFVFSHEAMNNLKSEAKDEDDPTSPTPTRYQALSCFLTKHMILSNPTPTRTATTVIFHIVDVRRRMGPPLSHTSMGNLLWPTLIPYPHASITPHTTLKHLLPIMTRAIGRINKDLFVRMKEDPDFLASDLCGELLLEGMEESEGVVSFVFTSWSNLGFKDLDFGWGKPLWVGFRGGRAQNAVPNTVVFVDTEEGIEAWVSMDEERLAVLENDADFLRFALLNPSVQVSCT